MPTQKIGLLGGSFNPPHLGHVGICRYVLDTKSADKVWVIPCFEHPFDKPLVSFEHRFKMCELAFSEFSNKVQVLDIEKRLGGKSYTLRTVRNFKQQHPSTEFLLIVGSDAVSEAPAWKDYEILKNEVDWLVIPRGSPPSVPDVSATDVRKRLEQGLSVRNAVPDSVLQYIKAHRLWAAQ